MQMDFLQPRHVHQPGFGADGHMIALHIAGIAPGGRHAVPVFQLGPSAR